MFLIARLHMEMNEGQNADKLEVVLESEEDSKEERKMKDSFNSEW
jgi:hypothetical protein